MYTRALSEDSLIDFDQAGDTVWLSLWGVTSPPALDVDVTTLDFGETDTSRSIQITNSGGGTLKWNLSEQEEWMTVNVISGSLEASASTTVTVTVDRSEVPTIGVVDGTITVTSNGGNTGN